MESKSSHIIDPQPRACYLNKQSTVPISLHKINITITDNVLSAYALRQGILSAIVSLDPGVVNGYTRQEFIPCNAFERL